MHFASNPLPKSLGQTYYKKSASWITAMSHNKLKEDKKADRAEEVLKPLDVKHEIMKDYKLR
jgi:hypothetical protein